MNRRNIVQYYKFFFRIVVKLKFTFLYHNKMLQTISDWKLLLYINLSCNFVRFHLQKKYKRNKFVWERAIDAAFSHQLKGIHDEKKCKLICINKLIKTAVNRNLFWKKKQTNKKKRLFTIQQWWFRIMRQVYIFFVRKQQSPHSQKNNMS